MDTIVLNQFPMPPSVNSAYRNLNVLGRPGRVKTAEYKQFERDVSLWASANAETVKRARGSLQARQEARLVVDCMLCFPIVEIMCKDGTVKKNDSSNRLKCLHDALAVVLDTDDKHFWSGSFDKAVDTDGHRHVMISIYEYGAEHHT